MKSSKFFLYFSILAIAQILMNNYLNLSQMMTLTVLPTLILCAPLGITTPILLLIAFGTGFAVDFFSTGQLGLTSAALLPVALLRVPILSLGLGNEIFSRQEDISKARQGALKVSMAVLLALLVYLLVFIWIDSAGTHPFWFNLVKLLLSLLASYLVSLIVTKMICP